MILNKILQAEVEHGHVLVDILKEVKLLTSLLKETLEELNKTNAMIERNKVEDRFKKNDRGLYTRRKE